MNRPQLLWLIWQNIETRQRYHVGNLIYQDDIYIFQYENIDKNRSLKAALDNGYNPHLAFPDLKMTYTSDHLFGPFARRLPNRNRPDFKKLLIKFGLDDNSTDMDFLSATGGKLATDSYEFVNPIFVKDNKFILDFYIAGWSHYEGDTVINQLQLGSKLILQPDPENIKDKFAIKILTEDNILLGYVPAFYSEVLSEATILKSTILNIDNEAIPQLKVKLRTEGSLSEDSNYHKHARETSNLFPIYFEV